MKTEVEWFECSRNGSGRSSLGGDVLVSIAKSSGSNGPRVCVRFSGDVMDALRWRAKDRVKFGFYDDDGTRLVVRRVHESDKTGFTLSAPGKEVRSATVRCPANAKQLRSVFGDEVAPFTMTLVEGNTEEAVFARDA